VRTARLWPALVPWARTRKVGSSAMAAFSSAKVASLEASSTKIIS